MNIKTKNNQSYNSQVNPEKTIIIAKANHDIMLSYFLIGAVLSIVLIGVIFKAVTDLIRCPYYNSYYELVTGLLMLLFGAVFSFLKLKQMNAVCICVNKDKIFGVAEDSILRTKSFEFNKNEIQNIEIKKRYLIIYTKTQIIELNVENKKFAKEAIERIIKS